MTITPKMLQGIPLIVVKPQTSLRGSGRNRMSITATLGEVRIQVNGVLTTMDIIDSTVAFSRVIAVGSISVDTSKTQLAFDVANLAMQWKGCSRLRRLIASGSTGAARRWTGGEFRMLQAGCPVPHNPANVQTLTGTIHDAIYPAGRCHPLTGHRRRLRRAFIMCRGLPSRHDEKGASGCGVGRDSLAIVRFTGRP